MARRTITGLTALGVASAATACNDFTSCDGLLFIVTRALVTINRFGSRRSRISRATSTERDTAAHHASENAGACLVLYVRSLID